MEKLLVGKSLEHQLDTVIKELAPKGNISYVVLQFDDEEEPIIIASKGEDMVHSSASLIKVLIMEYVFHLARTEQLDLMIQFHYLEHLVLKVVEHYKN